MTKTLVVGGVLVVVGLLACVQYYDIGRSTPCTLRLLRTPLPASTHPQYVPDELESLLVCITFIMNVGTV
jgi:hypothetical protein